MAVKQNKVNYNPRSSSPRWVFLVMFFYWIFFQNPIRTTIEEVIRKMLPFLIFCIFALYLHMYDLFNENIYFLELSIISCETTPCPRVLGSIHDDISTLLAAFKSQLWRSRETLWFYLRESLPLLACTIQSCVTCWLKVTKRENC